MIFGGVEGHGDLPDRKSRLMEIQAAINSPVIVAVADSAQQRRTYPHNRVCGQFGLDTSVFPGPQHKLKLAIASWRAPSGVRYSWVDSDAAPLNAGLTTLLRNSSWPENINFVTVSTIDTNGLSSGKHRCKRRFMNASFDGMRFHGSVGTHLRRMGGTKHKSERINKLICN